MSKKGQDNQSGITFQNKVAFLYMLDNYKYFNFLKIKLEGSQAEDFTLFFKDINNQSSFFHEFEVKNWEKPLTLNNVRKIIKKQVEKGIWRDSEKGSFYIVASSFEEECKKQIKSFKNEYLFHSYKDFHSIKKMYKKIYGEHPILDWSEEEIVFLNKKVILKELDEKSTDKRIQEWFHYEQSFFYTKENTQNIISRLFQKITEKSSVGGELTKQRIRNLITEFCNEETNKSESYDLNEDLGRVIQEYIEKKLQTEDEFNSLNEDKYITPISKRERAIFYIVDKLKEKDFSFKKIKWFFDKILIKDRYMLHGLGLLKQYAGKESLDSEDKDNILRFIFKLYEYESKSSPVYQSSFNNLYKSYIFKILLKLSVKNISEGFKTKIHKFLNTALPDWETIHQDLMEYESYGYRHVPQIIKNTFGYTENGIELFFKKYDFTRIRDHQNHIHYDYIEQFINQDFENNFPVVIKGLVAQFTILYKKIYGFDDYKGYELSGGGYFGSNGRYQLSDVKWEPLLSNCVIAFYAQKKNWDFFQSIIDAPYSKENPVFLKRILIPLLLQQLQNASEKNPKENKFYKALESILEIKTGFPFTEEIVIDLLYRRYLNYTDFKGTSGLEDLLHTDQDINQEDSNKINIKIPSVYLDLIIKKILYKHSKEGISYNILMIQLIMRLIEMGQLQFKEHLKRILRNKDFQKSFKYEQALKILDGKINNQHIKKFFNEIKNKIDISQNKSLMYTNVAVISTSPAFEKLFKSSAKDDLDNLADILQIAFWKNNHDFLKKVLTFMDSDFIAFYERAKVSEKLMQVIPQIATLYASSLLKKEKMAESIIDRCVKNTDLCGEKKSLHEEILKEDIPPRITTMRARLCNSINSYVSYYCRRQDKNSLKKLEKAFSWIKILMDLNGALAKNIPNFPMPNYYLRCFAIMPLINLSYYQVRENLNKYKSGLGDEVKKFAFAILEQTEKEIEENTYNPVVLFNQITRLFDLIRDLKEEEAKKVLCFIRKFNIAEAGYLFIYYAIFREKYSLFSEKVFKADWFKKELKRICQGKTDNLKRKISSSLYRDFENKNKETNKPNPDFDFFEKIKDYWILLFEDIKGITFSLIQTLAIVLDRDKNYYDRYKKHLFKLLEKELKNIEESKEDCYLHLDEVLQAVAKHEPDDLTKILLLFLKKGNKVTGSIPFRYEVVEKLIPEIKKQKNKIDDDKIKKLSTELKKYNITFMP